MVRTSLLGALLALTSPAVALAQLQVVSHAPALNAPAATTAAISVEFDQAVDTATVDVASFRAFGVWSGPVRGTFSFSNGDKTVTLTPDDPFTVGEFVYVNLSHDIESATNQPLRSAGYAFQFITAVAPSSATFEFLDRFTNVTSGQTRIYGAAGADLNDDGYLDLTTVNEVSADVRVFLNRADGTGLYDPMLPRQAIGVEASPNFPADFDNDGFVDLVVGAADSDDVWVLIGDGDGTFSPVTGLPIGGGSEPHGVAPIDADGDGDLDIVSANVGANNLALLVNDGAGNFAAPAFFEGGVNGEYGLVAADMNGDGIGDLVVGGRNGSEIAVMLGDGDGTFTAAGPAQSAGGSTWVVVLGDLNGDGELDVASANDGDGNIGVLMGNGDGTFDPVSTIAIGSHVPSVDLGDLDGDGDLDMVVSSFGGGFWSWHRNDGTGSFTEIESFPAPDNPSCAVLLDIDNDGDLDLGLTDEIDDTITLMKNGGSSSCSPAPGDCRGPILAGKSKLVLKDKTTDTLAWTLRRGQSTAEADFGSPTTVTDYALCLYEDDTLVVGFDIPAGSEWRDVAKGFSYRDPGLAPDGILAARLIDGAEGQARMKVRGKGPLLDMPALGQLDGVLDVQLQRAGSAVCWGATYTPPFRRNDGQVLVALSDEPPPATLDPVWSEIHAQVVGPVCGGCHGPGGFSGLSGLQDCNLGHASLVGVASTELPSMNRVLAGDPSLSWLMHKLDDTQGPFSAMCTGMFCGQLMPLGGPQLSMEIRDTIRDWITNGAVNDCP